MNTAELRQQEIDQAELQADAAATAQRNVLSKSTVAVAAAIIAALQVDQKRGAVIEPATDLSDLTNNPDLSEDLAHDLLAAGLWLRTEIPQWIAAGWQAEADGQTEILSTTAPAITLNASLTPAETRALSGYPVQGHDSMAIAAHLVNVLEYEAQGALGQLLSDAATAKDVPAALDEVQRQHSERVRTIAREAFFAGCQCARLEIGNALAGK